MDAPKRLLESSSLSSDARRLLESYDPTPRLPDPVAVDVAERLVELPATGGGFAMKAGLAVLTVLGGGALWFAASTGGFDLGAFDLDGAVAEAPSAVVAPAGERGADGMKFAGNEGAAGADATNSDDAVGGDDADATNSAGGGGGDPAGATNSAGAAGAAPAGATNSAGAAGAAPAGAMNSAGAVAGDEVGATKSTGTASREETNAKKSTGAASGEAANAKKSAGDAAGAVANATNSGTDDDDDGPNAMNSAGAPTADGDDATNSAPTDSADDTNAMKSGGLAEELRILDAGKRALAASPSKALEQVRLHRDVFPNGQLADLRDFLEIRAYEGVGAIDRAAQLREAFLENHPGSALVRELKQGSAKPTPQ
ncbi:MAG: hypothetical protein RL846_39020 [Deltaproteobacteria bacterium]